MSLPIPTKFRVLQVAEATAGGVRVHLRRVVPELLARGIAVDLILSPLRAEPDFADDVEFYRQLGCRVDLYPMKRGPAPLADWKAIGHVRRRLREWQPQIIHAHATKAGLLARLAAAPFSMVKSVYSPHVFLFEAFFKQPLHCLAVGVERGLRSRTDLFVLVSRSEMAAAEGVCRIASERVCLVENGLPQNFVQRLLDRDQARAEWNISPETKAVCVPGRLVDQKGQDWLLRSIAELNLKKLGLHFYFCGTGPMESALRRLCRQLGLTPFVTWMGHVVDLTRRLAAFDLVVLPSRYEAFSYVLLETLAAGVPLIVSDLEANFPRQELRNYVPSVGMGDEPGLARLITAFVESQWRMDAVRDASEFVQRSFRLEEQADQLVACYRRLVAEAP